MCRQNKHLSKIGPNPKVYISCRFICEKMNIYLKTYSHNTVRNPTIDQVFLSPYAPKAAVCKHFWIRVEATRHYVIFRACNNRCENQLNALFHLWAFLIGSRQLLLLRIARKVCIVSFGFYGRHLLPIRDTNVTLVMTGMETILKNSSF